MSNRFATSVYRPIARTLCILALAASAKAQSNAPPVRWQASYTQIYSDDLETLSPALGAAFALEGPGALTSEASEVIAGKTSIRAQYSGSSSSPSFLRTNGSVLPLAANHRYTVSFQYKILVAPSDSFYIQFLSFVAASQQSFLPGLAIRGAAGTTGTATLTSTLGNYSDYVVYWGRGGPTTSGAISIDNIRITDAATGNVLVFEDAETIAPGPRGGIRFESATAANAAQAISGKGSLLLYGALATNPTVLPLAGNTVYTIKFDYRILSRGSSDNILSAVFQPVGSTDPKLQVMAPPMFKNSAAVGTFSTGAQTAGESSYVLTLSLSPSSSLVIDNLVLYRQDVTTQTTMPASWSRLLTLPFPRLGDRFALRTDYVSSLALDEKAPFTYTVEQIERRLAFKNLIAEISPSNQTQNPDSIFRIRALNPDVVILPTKDVQYQTPSPAAPSNSNVDLEVQIERSTPAAWKGTTTDGTVIFSQYYPANYFMNLSDFVPAINGQTWLTTVQSSVTSRMWPSGLWDGVFFLSLAGTLDPQLPHHDDPALFNYDWNRNGQRDETLAATSEMVRAASLKILAEVNSSVKGMQLIVANTDRPAFALAPFVNGFAFECLNHWWGQAGGIAASSPGRWRTSFDGYLRMQAIESAPQINLLEGCGSNAADFFTFTGAYLNPNAEDFQKHRLSLGTTLLGNGFYDYDLKDTFSAPYWFDEYSVDAAGTAVENPANKGYLGHPLSDAVELTSPGTLVAEEEFEGAAPPKSFALPANGGAFITQTKGEVISGNGSLVISNPDHTRNAFVVVGVNFPLTPGVQYMLTLDWRVLESLDQFFYVTVSNGGEEKVIPPAYVTGDAGTLRFPFVAPAAANSVLQILLYGGGGKIAIDNVKLSKGGAGPWRRDFENGFVLVNPFAQPHTFSASELAGSLSRTGIRHIKGTQAPDINNGLPVSSNFAVGAFDAVILLADRIAVRTPVISSVSTVGGFPDIAQNTWIEIKGTDLAPAGAASGLTWSQSLAFESGFMPAELGGVRVTVNGKPAFVYFVNENQVNVLSPLDDAKGPVEIVVTSGGVSSPPYVVTLREAAPSFPLVGSTKYVVGVHADYSLIGQPSLSSPGYAFTPARPGETILLYVYGLGLPLSPLANGAATQSGALPALPRVQIGGVGATVRFAGLISPGLYQLNVLVPSGIPSGDNPLTLTYNGQSSPSGAILTVQ